MLIKNGENGLLVPVGDAEKLRDAMEKVLCDQVLAKKLSINGVRLRETYSIDKIAEQWLDYIQKVIQ